MIHSRSLLIEPACVPRVAEPEQLDVEMVTELVAEGAEERSERVNSGSGLVDRCSLKGPASRSRTTCDPEHGQCRTSSGAQLVLARLSFAVLAVVVLFPFLQRMIELRDDLRCATAHTGGLDE